MIQIKHINGEVHFIKDGARPIDNVKMHYLIMSEEDAISVLGKENPIVRECRNYTNEGKRKQIEELEYKLKKLKETL